MVRILANGDIVQDDDPRVRKAPQRREDLNRPRQGFIRNSGNANQPHQGQGNQGRSLFMDMNQRLINMGFPRWNLGNQVIEPIMSVLLILLLMLVGMRGLLLIGGLYLFSQFSHRRILKMNLEDRPQEVLGILLPSAGVQRDLCPPSLRFLERWRESRLSPARTHYKEVPTAS